MQVKCDYCGEMTRQTPARIKKHKHHFCNNKCRIAYRCENSIAKGKRSHTYQKKLKDLASKYQSKYNINKKQNIYK